MTGRRRWCRWRSASALIATAPLTLALVGAVVVQIPQPPTSRELASPLRPARRGATDPLRLLRPTLGSEPAPTFCAPPALHPRSVCLVPPGPNARPQGAHQSRPHRSPRLAVSTARGPVLALPSLALKCPPAARRWITIPPPKVAAVNAARGSRSRRGVDHVKPAAEVRSARRRDHARRYAARARRGRGLQAMEDRQGGQARREAQTETQASTSAATKEEKTPRGVATTWGTACAHRRPPGSRSCACPGASRRSDDPHR